MKCTLKNFLVVLTLAFILTCRMAAAETPDYPIVDTGQDRCFNTFGEMSCPGPGQAFYGQDAQYQGYAPAYRDNGDGTVTDLTTGLMWQKGLGTKKVSLDEARELARTLTLGGYTDWQRSRNSTL